MSDLRTRIASALKKADETVFITDPFAVPEPSYSELADAVIAELGLEEERGGTYEVGGEATSHRYVTDWEPDRQPRSAEKLGLTGDGT